MSNDEARGRVVRLLMEHRHTLFAFIYAVVRDFDLAEEVFQEVSVAVCAGSEAFQPGTNFGAWAREIARRRILAQRRLENRFPELLSDEAILELQAGFDEVEAASGLRDRVAALQACLETLSPAARRLLELRYTARLRLAEIASQLGRQAEGVRKALYRTREVLRLCIQRRLSREEGR
ncbi:MAG: sigma-70 family RNA polymerase sigma factor [Thermoguttaceae bacterium]